jgi:hypothetical protein
MWAETGDPILALAANYATPGGLIAVGRTNYADQVIKDVSAGGGTVLIYVDAIINNAFGRYHDLLLNSSVYGAAVPLWPGVPQANQWGSLNDFRTTADGGGGVLQSKLEPVLELIVSENPHLAGFFMDDVGSRSWFDGINWTTFPSQSAYRNGAIAICQTVRTVCDRHGLIFIVNGTWTANDGGGYPLTTQHGCSLADGGFVEHHDGEISFWGPYVDTSTQWANESSVTNGNPVCWAAMNTSAGLTEFNNDGRFAYTSLQNTDPGYDGVAPWGSFHATGLPSSVRF